MPPSEPSKLLAVAGLATWALVLVVNAGAALRAPLVAASLVVFAAAFALATLARGRARRLRVAALAAQTMAALVLVARGDGGFEGALLAVVAAQAPFFLPPRAALAWVVAESAAQLCELLATGASLRGALVATGAFGAFDAFAFGAALLADRETRAARELLRVHAELLATRELFADATRAEERLRIARELHDSLGHHLTALALNLEVAKNTVDARATEPVDRAHAIAKDLLAELRAVVSELREDAPLDLPHALRTLAAGIPRPKVHLDVPEALRAPAPLAHALFRCVQEALTNVVRHAGAENVWIAVREESGAFAVSARDDGRGEAREGKGHGIAGLRERLEAIGGRLEIDARPGEGVTLRARLPLRAGANGAEAAS